MKRMKLFRIIKYKIVKYVHIHSQSYKEQTEIESNAITIFKNLLSKADAELTIAPISVKKIVRWNDMTAILSENRITIFDNNMYYDILISMAAAERLISKFNMTLEARALKIESEVKNNSNASLVILLNYARSSNEDLKND